jgi:hypothetical protein
MSLDWVSRIRSTPPTVFKVRYNMLLFTHLRLRLQRCFLSWGITTKMFYVFMWSAMRTSFPVHLMLFCFVILIIFGERYKSRSFSLFNYFQLPITLSLLGPNIPLSILVFNTLNRCFSLNVRDQVSYSYKNKCRNAVSCISIFRFLNSKRTL